MQESLPQLSRSALHRCFQRHGISRLPPPEVPAAGPDKRKKFKAYPIGYLHVDFAERRTEEGKQYLFVAVDRTSKVAIAELHPAATQAIAAGFLRQVLAQLPYQVHTVLTDNGGQFGNMPPHVHCGRHVFDQVCDEPGIAHRFTKPAHPWTNGQVERMNRTLKEATIKVYHYATTEALNTHLQTFLRAYLFAKRLKTLKGRTPHEFVCAEWRKNPSIFPRDPTLHPLGLYTYPPVSLSSMASPAAGSPRTSSSWLPAPRWARRPPCSTSPVLPPSTTATNTAIFSLEMPTLQLMQRLVASEVPGQSPGTPPGQMHPRIGRLHQPRNRLSNSPDHTTSPSASIKAASSARLGKKLCFDSPPAI